MNEARIRLLSTVVKWGLGILGAAIVAPIIFLAVKGLVGLAIAGVIGTAIIKFAPVISMKFENWKLKAIKAEAEANPIETMQNIYKDRSIELDEKLKMIAAFGTEVRNLDDQVAELKQNYPEDAPRYEDYAKEMHHALDGMQAEADQASQALQTLTQQIRRAEQIYKVALAMDKVTTLSKTAETRVFTEIKQQVAIDSIKSRVNQSFANLDVAVRKREMSRVSPPSDGKLLPST